MADHAAHNLPTTYKGLQFTSADEPAKIIELTTPLPTAGTVILRPLYSNIVSYAKNLFRNGNPMNHNYPLPLIPGSNAICRVAAVPSDSLFLKLGMLVYASGVVRPRDNALAAPTLLGNHMGYTPESQALMEGEWRNGTWAELVKLPLENVHVLNEEVLIKELGYNIADLGYMSTLMVAYGGLSDVALRPGETVAIAPATGNYGSTAVFVALAMGAGKVIAMGRDTEKLKRILDGAGSRVRTVGITGDVDTDTKNLQAHGPIDVYFDISPNLPSTPSHLKAGIAALRPKGRVSLMGGIHGNVEVPYITFMLKGLSIHGTFMYTRQQIDEFIKLVETGLLPLGEKAGFEVAGAFSLDRWEEALECAYDNRGPRKSTFFVPNGK